MKIQLYFYALSVFFRFALRKANRIERKLTAAQELADAREAVRVWKRSWASSENPKARRKAKRLGKPCKGEYARSIQRIGARPKIVTSSDFPSRANAIHFQPPKSERIDHLKKVSKYA